MPPARPTLVISSLSSTFANESSSRSERAHVGGEIREQLTQRRVGRGRLHGTQRTAPGGVGRGGGRSDVRQAGVCDRVASRIGLPARQSGAVGVAQHPGHHEAGDARGGKEEAGLTACELAQVVADALDTTLFEAAGDLTGLVRQLASHV